MLVAIALAGGGAVWALSGDGSDVRDATEPNGTTSVESDDSGSSATATTELGQITVPLPTSPLPSISLPSITLPAITLPSSTASPTGGLPLGEPPEGLGDDPRLDALAQDCYDGEMSACDDLFDDAPTGSSYESYGDTCAERQPANTGLFCTSVFPNAAPTTA